MTGIFWGAFHVYGSSTYQILKDQQIEFTDILVEGDSLVLVRNEKNGFSSEGTYLGVYNCVERMWIAKKKGKVVITVKSGKKNAKVKITVK